LIPDPGYPCYRQLLNFLGIIPEVLPLAARMVIYLILRKSNTLVLVRKSKR